jgi:hypothetical protein
MKVLLDHKVFKVFRDQWDHKVGWEQEDYEVFKEILDKLDHKVFKEILDRKVFEDQKEDQLGLRGQLV